MTLRGLSFFFNNMDSDKSIKAPLGTTPSSVMRSYRMPLQTLDDLKALAKQTGKPQTQILIKGVELQKNAHLSD